MSRTTWSMSDEAAKSLEDAASRKEHESANDFILRVAEIVSEVNNTSGVTKRNAQSEGEDSGGCDVPEDVLTEAHIDDIANKAARQTVNDLESRLR